MTFFEVKRHLTAECGVSWAALVLDGYTRSKKIIIHNFHNKEEVKIEYLELIFYCVNI